MGKILVIKGADFSAVAVGTVTIPTGTNLVTEVINNEFFNRNENTYAIASGTEMANSWWRTNAMDVAGGSTYTIQIPGYSGAALRGVFYDANNNNLTKGGITVTNSVTAPSGAAKFGISGHKTGISGDMTAVPYAAAQQMKVYES